MTRCTWFPVLIGMTLLAGCARPPADPGLPEAPQPSALTDRGDLAGAKSLDLVIQAPGDGSPAGWTQADIDLYRIELKDDTDTPIQSIDLLQKNLPAGESPRSRLRFEGLRHGETYHAYVLAIRGESQVLNSQSPTALTFAFTGEQDVEDSLSGSAIILLDDRRFSGTMRIPVYSLRKEFDKDHRDKSTSMSVRLETVTRPKNRVVFTKVFDATYSRPAGGWYSDYQLVNLSYGVTYRVILTMNYPQGNSSKTEELKSSNFMPFPDTATDSYIVPTNKF